MDQLRKMAIFATVVELNGFSAAARKLQLTRSAISRHVAALEADLGVRLLQRTTRRLRLTEEGELYFRSCARIVAEAESAERAVRKLQREPLGTLRVSAPVIGHRLLIPAVHDFMARHPGVRVDLSLEDHYVNLIEEGIDVALRIGLPRDSALVARKLGPVRQVVCGAPAYLKRRGTPRAPRDLVGHEWIIYSLLAAPTRFVFTRAGSRQVVRVAGRLRLNGGPAIRDALLLGLGLTVMPAFYVTDDLRQGRLQPVLTDYDVKRSAMHAVYPHRDHLSTKVRAFVDFLAERIGDQLAQA